MCTSLTRLHIGLTQTVVCVSLSHLVQIARLSSRSCACIIMAHGHVTRLTFSPLRVACVIQRLDVGHEPHYQLHYAMCALHFVDSVIACLTCLAVLGRLALLTSVRYMLEVHLQL